MIDYAEWVNEYEQELERLVYMKDKLEAKYNSTIIKDENGRLDLKYRIAHYKQLILECQSIIIILKEKAKKFKEANQNEQNT